MTDVTQGGDGEQQESSRNQPETIRNEPVVTPLTDIIETNNEFVMLLDMPGADPDTLDVTLDERVLNISARSESSAPQGYSLIYGEYRNGSYERQFIVSDVINSDGIDAELKDGVLRIVLPKTTPSPAKKISVKLH
ncbi:MAG: putative molecular chaperone small heat shock protein hsp20 family [Hyphomicrobiales bacterium]|nr:putative molecular chaperone small heat shock protein hsp20 family [Hyphomicrobiales bacterium]